MDGQKITGKNNMSPLPERMWGGGSGNKEKSTLSGIRGVYLISIAK